MSQQGVVKLKELLFDRERREIDILAQQLEEVARRAGSEAQIRRSVATVLEGAIRDAEATGHRELADALAPLVVRTIRSEIETASEALPAKLYPHIGRMVRDYVTSAIRDLMEDINRRLEGGIHNNRLMLWVRSWTSGRSMAELALADSGRLDVDEIHLIERGSGLLVAHWVRGNGPAAEVSGSSNRGALFSGMLTAMTAFIEEVYEPEKASLRTIDFGEHTLFLRGSPTHLLVAKCRGEAGAGLEQLLDDELLSALDGHRAASARPGAAAPALDLETLAGRLEQQIAERGRVNRRARAHSGTGPLKWLLALVLLAASGLLGWQGYISWQTSQLQAAADGLLAATPELRGYPTLARVARGGGSIEVSGLAPSGAVRTHILEGLRALAPDATILETIGIVPGGSAAETAAEVARLRTALAEVEAESRRDAERRVLTRARLRLERLGGELETLSQPLRANQQAMSVLGEARDAARETERAIAGWLSSSAGRKAVDRGGLDSAIARLGHIEVVLQGLLVDARSAGVRLSPVASTSDDRAEQLAQLTDRLASLVGAISADMARKPLVTELDVLRRELAAAKRVSPPPAPPPPSIDPRVELDLWMRTNAVFFSKDADFRDPDRAKVVLDELARLMVRTGATVRVVGFTDERGGTARNGPIAQSRAERVTADLVQRGISPDRLMAFGRSSSGDISPRSGTDSPNRRVSFELAYDGEQRPAP